MCYLTPQSIACPVARYSGVCQYGMHSAMCIVRPPKSQSPTERYPATPRAARSDPGVHRLDQLKQPAPHRRQSRQPARSSRQTMTVCNPCRTMLGLSWAPPRLAYSPLPSRVCSGRCLVTVSLLATQGRLLSVPDRDPSLAMARPSITRPNLQEPGGPLKLQIIKHDSATLDNQRRGSMQRSLCRAATARRKRRPPPALTSLASSGLVQRLYESARINLFSSPPLLFLAWASRLHCA